MTVTTRRPLALGRAGWRYSLRRWKQRGNVRCRLVASWGWSRSQGLGCSPIKAVRELGLERRETVREIAVYKSGQMLETPVHLSLLKSSVTMRRVRTISRKDWVACAVQNPQRLYAGRSETPKIQSELHGDMQSRAEMTRPRGGNHRE